VDSAKRQLVTRILSHPADAISEAPAIEQGDRTITYGDLSMLVASRARLLNAEVTAVHRRKSIEYLVDLFAVLDRGGIAVPIDPDLPPERRETFLRLARPTVMLGDGGVRKRETQRETQPGQAAWPGLPDDGALIWFTSGSTGVPKPVLSSASAVKSFVDWFCPEFGFGPGDRFAFLTGVSFEASMRDIFPSLACGATLVLPEDETDGTDALEWLADKAITVVTVVPSLARAWLRHGRVTCPSVRAVFFVGEPVPADVLTGWRTAFPNTTVRVNSYGSTEGGQATIFHRIDHRIDAADTGPIPAGRPVPGTKYCYIAPESALTADAVRAALASPREEGEIVVVSRACSHGYLGLPEENAARFADLGDGVKAYRTGDLGRTNADGELVVIGRADDEVKINGVRVHPAEVTQALRAHTAVADAFVAATRNGDAARLTAYFVPAEPARIDGNELRRDLLDSLPLAFIPSRFVPVDHLPRTRTGKVDRAALTALAADPVDFQPPAGEVELWLAAQLADIVGARDISATGDLFALGADSIAATRLAARIASESGIELSQKDIFVAATIRELADVIIERQLLAADPDALAEALDALDALAEESAGRP